MPVRLCNFRFPDDHLCGSPALRTGHLCYHHARSPHAAGPRRRTTRPGYRWYTIRRAIPTLDRQQAIFAFSLVMQAIAEGRNLGPPRRAPPARLAPTNRPPPPKPNRMSAILDHL